MVIRCSLVVYVEDCSDDSFDVKTDPVVVVCDELLTNAACVEYDLILL